MKISLTELLGRKVYGITGPGQGANDDFAASIGVVESIENTMFGNVVHVQWYEGESMGHKTPHMLHTIRPASEQLGCGVYYQD